MYRVKGAERRAFPRYQVELPTEIEFAERFRRHCRITNICTDGALVEWRTSSAEAEPTPAASDHCRLEIRINASGAAPLLAEAQVIHAFDNGFGVRFTRFENNGQIRLQRYLAGLFHGPSGQGTATPADARPLLKKFTLSRLDDLTRMLNQSLSDVLWSAGEAATSDQERALFISAASALARAHAEKRLQDGLRRRLFDAISDWGRASGNGRSDQSGSLPSSLELVDKENFELWLAKAALANHLEKTLEAPLLEMRALVRQAGPHGLPFEPAELTDTIEHTLTALGLETLPCIRCLQGLREDLPEWLDPMYRELASAWLKAGLGRPAATAPEPAPKAAASPDIPRQAPPPTPPSAAPDARAQTEAAPAAAPNRSLAQWLLQQSMQQPASPPGGALALKGQVLQMVAAAAADQAAVALTPQLEERVDAPSNC